MTQPELTEAARRNVAKGAKTGAGTGYCRRCDGSKEERRLNSNNCQTCDNGTNLRHRTEVKKGLRTDLPADVWDRLQAEAAEKQMTLAEFVRDLIVARDERKHG